MLQTLYATFGVSMGNHWSPPCPAPLIGSLVLGDACVSVPSRRVLSLVRLCGGCVHGCVYLGHISQREGPTALCVRMVSHIPRSGLVL